MVASRWKKMGLDSSERISRIAVSSKNSDVVYVAVPGHLFNDDANRGVYKTTDGGKTWNKILFVDGKTGCADLAIDPQNPDIVYAAMWQFRRTPYSFASGGSTSALYKSSDGGATWKKLTNGLPATTMGRIAIDVSPANPKIVYASVEYDQTAVFKSSDRGETWKRMGTTGTVIERPFYFSRLICDPKDTNTFYRGGLSMVISRDGGISYSSVSGGAHGDQHDLWVDPNNTDHLLMGTDGGAYMSFNQGGTWILCRDLPVGQFYHVAYDFNDPYDVYGGLQDNFSWYGPSSSNTGNIDNKEWHAFSFGDGFGTFPDQLDNNIIYTEIQGGFIIRYEKNSKIFKTIKPYAAKGEPKLRFNWNAALNYSPNNPTKIYFGAQYVFVSYDKGETWKKASPDLTTNNPKYQQQENSGGVTSDNSSAENHCTIYTIAESPLDSSVIWVGTDDGNMQLSRDGGKSWTNTSVNLKGLPKEPWITTIEPGHYDKGTAYATLDYHYWGNMKPYVVKTTDFGATWSVISNDSIRGYCHVVREDLKNKNLLFVGSEMGLFVSIDGGANWSQLNNNNNIPDVAIRDMVIHPRDNALILATHGRGIMIIDDLGMSILQQLTPDIVQQKFYLFPTKPYIIPLQGIDFGYSSDDEFFGSNPNNSPQISYYLKERQLIGDFKVEVLGDDGKVINSATIGKHKGVNIANVPLSMKPPKVPPAPLVAGFAAQGVPLPEGTYKLRVIHGKDTTMTSITVQPPKVFPYTAEDRKIRWDNLMQVYNQMNEFAYNVDCITTMRDQAKQTADKLPAKDKLKPQLQNLEHILDTLHGSLVLMQEGAIVDQFNGRLREQFAGLYGTIIGYEGRPNTPALEQVGTLQSKSGDAEKTFETIMNQYLPKINQQLKQKNLPELQRKSKEEFEKTAT